MLRTAPLTVTSDHTPHDAWTHCAVTGRIAASLPWMLQLALPYRGGDDVSSVLERTLEHLLVVGEQFTFTTTQGETLPDEFTLGYFDEVSRVALIGVFISNETEVPKFYQMFGLTASDLAGLDEGTLGFIVLHIPKDDTEPFAAVAIAAVDADFRWEYDAYKLPGKQRLKILEAGKRALEDAL